MDGGNAGRAGRPFGAFCQGPRTKIVADSVPPSSPPTTLTVWTVPRPSRRTPAPSRVTDCKLRRTLYLSSLRAPADFPLHKRPRWSLSRIQKHGPASLPTCGPSIISPEEASPSSWSSTPRAPHSQSSSLSLCFGSGPACSFNPLTLALPVIRTT